MKSIIHIIIICFIPFIASTQNSRMKHADKMYDQLAYFYAAEAYEDVLERSKDSAEVSINIADSYYRLGNVKKADAWYGYLYRKSKISKEQHIRYALLKRQLNDYTASNKLISEYESKYKSTDVTRNLKKENETLYKLSSIPSLFGIKQTPDINSESSDMGISFFGSDKVLIASSRKSGIRTRVDGWTGGHYYDIYIGKMNILGEIKDLSLLKGKSKTKFHDGTTSFDVKNNILYFTRSNTSSSSKTEKGVEIVRLKIYQAEMVDNKFSSVNELHFNSESYSCAHPSISADGKFLYFASDMPGGYGGTDLYRVEIFGDGSFGHPVNLGEKINTSRNESFPYVHPTENLLFFASDGHFGFGGLDVYVAKMNRSLEITKIENLGTPVNSISDDFGFINDSDQTMAFLSSNREGGKGSDDIYAFTQIAPIRSTSVINGNVTNMISKDKIQDAHVIVQNLNGDLIDSVQTDEDGNFSVFLDDYAEDIILKCSAPQYNNAEKIIVNIPNTSEYNEDISLMPIIDYYLTGIVREKSTKKPLEDVHIKVTSNYNKELVLSSNTAGKFSSDILEYCTYNDTAEFYLVVEKEGYITKSIEVSKILDTDPQIAANGELPIELTKIDLGKTDLGEVLNLSPIYFDYDKYDVRPDAAIELDKVVKIMKENPKMVIELGSHTDSRGNDNYNLSLSDRRAKASAAYIISQGIDKQRITGKGYGKRKLKYTDKEITKADSQEEKERLHELNRRTEFIIVKMK